LEAGGTGPVAHRLHKSVARGTQGSEGVRSEGAGAEVGDEGVGDAEVDGE